VGHVDIRTMPPYNDVGRYPPTVCGRKPNYGRVTGPRAPSTFGVGGGQDVHTSGGISRAMRRRAVAGAGSVREDRN